MDEILIEYFILLRYVFSENGFYLKLGGKNLKGIQDILLKYFLVAPLTKIFFTNNTKQSFNTQKKSNELI